MGKAKLVRFEVQGAVVAVRLAGEREKPALLLIHGFPSSSESFRNVIGILARECFVIAPDLPGFGGSEPIERPSFSRFADILQALLAQLGVRTNGSVRKRLRIELRGVHVKADVIAGATRQRSCRRPPLPLAPWASYFFAAIFCGSSSALT